MTTAAGAPASYWEGRLILDESPGRLGDPEIWADEGSLGMLAAPGGNWAPGAVIRFTEPPVLYLVQSRRTSPLNRNRPYYVLKRPD